MTTHEAYQILTAVGKQFSPFDMQHIIWGSENQCPCELCATCKRVAEEKRITESSRAYNDRDDSADTAERNKP